jgi:hypothetical protein
MSAAPDIGGNAKRLAGSSIGYFKPTGARPRVVVHHHSHVGDPRAAVEATDNGLLAPELAAGIEREIDWR